MARPNKEIKQQDFEKLCGLLCTEKEICAWFGVTDKTLSSWCKRTYGKGFSDIYKEKSEMGKIAIRRAQLQLAPKSAAMAIFLGKQYLGQKDNPIEVDHTVSPIDEITKLIFERQQEQVDTEEDIDK